MAVAIALTARITVLTISAVMTAYSIVSNPLSSLINLFNTAFIIVTVQVLMLA